MKITPRKKQVLEFVNSYSRKHGFAPSIPEIAKRFKLAISTVHQHLSELGTGGYLRREKNRPRSIAITEPETMIKVPLLGTIAAGEPIHVFEEEKEHIAVSKERLPKSGEFFALRVQGKSMIDEGINDGDTILVKKQQTAEDGQKVVALIDGEEATIKTFYKERDHVRLQPANKNYQPIIIKGTRVTIQGVLAGIVNISTETETPQVQLNDSAKYKEGIDISIKPKYRGPGWEFYLGDSIRTLPQLNRKYTVIYLDPPFNSNREYAYSAHGNELGFSDTWEPGEYERWLDELIKLCKDRLTKDGSLFFHISAELSLIPHLVLQKHFKKVEPILWKKAHGKNTVRNKLGSVVDIIFKASDNGSKFNLLYVPLDEYYFENSYKNKDEVGYYALGSIKHDKTRRGHFYRIQKGGITYEAPYGWKITRERLEALMKQDRIHFARPKPGTNRAMLYKKLYKHETKGKPLSNLWDDIAYITRTTKDQRLYPTQKPLELLKRIIQLTSKEGDWVLDPVAGSGTTGAAATLLNRPVTLIDVNKEAGEIIRERLKST